MSTVAGADEFLAIVEMSWSGVRGKADDDDDGNAGAAGAEVGDAIVGGYEESDELPSSSFLKEISLSQQNPYFCSIP